MSAVHVQSLAALDATNFLLADVQGGIAPFLSVYLLASLHWNPSAIGVAIAVSGIATLLVQTPAGAIVDRVTWKRHLMALAMIAIAGGSLATALLSGVAAIVAAQVIIGAAGAFLAPAIAALTLGLVGYDRLSARQGRNQVFNHAGNLFAALCGGAMGYLAAHVGIFYLASGTALAALVAIYAIREDDIDHARARGRESPDRATSSAWAILADRRLLLYAVAVVMFHFANAAMLPLVGQDLAAGTPHGAALYMAACVIIAQLVMMPVAAGTGQAAARFGRRPMFLVALACLPVRAAVFALSDSPGVLLAGQILDGVANGIFGVVNVLVIADLTRGTGRYNITLGVVATAIGLGAALSNGVSGFIVDALGYGGAFIVLGAIAVGAWLVFFFGVAETLWPKTGGAQTVSDL